jgi:hypothetical protein
MYQHENEQIFVDCSFMCKYYIIHLDKVAILCQKEPKTKAISKRHSCLKIS